MADTYGVTPADIAKELPALFRDGFSVQSKPSLALVESIITAADTKVRLRVTRAAGSASASDDTAALARRYIIDTTKAQIIRILYTGNAPQDVAVAAGPFDTLAKDTLAQIDEEIVESETDDITQMGWAGQPSGTTINVPVW